MATGDTAPAPSPTTRPPVTVVTGTNEGNNANETTTSPTTPAANNTAAATTTTTTRTSRRRTNTANREEENNNTNQNNTNTNATATPTQRNARERAAVPAGSGSQQGAAAAALPPPIYANFAQHPINLPPMTITKAPILLSATLLHEPWARELFQHQHRNACQLSYLCCPLLHFSRQLHTIDPLTYTGGMYNCVIFLACVADILTLRSPLACYPGLGTALFGWYTRLHIRLKFRIAGLGVKDFLYTSCCANYAVQQQFSELEKEGLGYPVPGGVVQLLPPPQRSPPYRRGLSVLSHRYTAITSAAAKP